LFFSRQEWLGEIYVLQKAESLLELGSQDLCQMALAKRDCLVMFPRD